MTKENGVGVLNHIRPTHLITSAGMYLLGSGLAKYLGWRIDSLAFLLGLVWLLLLQLGMLSIFMGQNQNST